MSDEDYIHGYSDDEAERLIDQAEFLARWVFARVRFEDARTLLEIGVGVGAETRILRRMFPSLHITGVELSARHLARAERTLAADVASGVVELHRASATRLPFAADRFDAIFICWVLEHVPDPQAVLDECARVLCPGGQLVAVEVYNPSLTIEPRQQLIEDYWTIYNGWQRDAGGHPAIGARLPSLAAAAGLLVEDFQFAPMIGDSRDPASRAQLIDYFETLLRSAEPRVVAEGAFDPTLVPSLRAAFEAVKASPDGLLAYTQAQLFARKPRR